MKKIIFLCTFIILFIIGCTDLYNNSGPVIERPENWVREPYYVYIDLSNDLITPDNIFYVSTDGDDKNPGTIDLPWKTIQHAADTVIPGQKIYVREGVYSEIVWIKKSGTRNNPIILSAHPGERVIIDGSEFKNIEPVFWGHINAAYQDNITIRGFVVRNAYRAGIVMDNSNHIIIEDNLTYNTLGSGIISYWGDDVTVRRNEIILACNLDMYNKTPVPEKLPCIQECLTVAGADGFTVCYNKIHHNGTAIAYGGEGLDVKHGSKNGSIHHNKVYNLNKLGIYVDTYALTSNIDIYCNEVHSCSDLGICVGAESEDPIENIRIFNNLVYGNRTIGIGVEGPGGWGPGSSHVIRDIYIYNNTVIYNGSIEWWGVGIHINAPDGENIQIYNNLIAFNGTEQIQVISEGRPKRLLIDNNLQYRGDWMGINEEYGTNTILEDPCFKNNKKRDGLLDKSSPAINRGNNTRRVPAFDYYENTRTADSFDIGAVEY